jgi:transposase
VISLETWQTIRHLASIGKSHRFIAQTLGITRKAVAKAIEEESSPAYERSALMQEALGSFQDEVERGLVRGVPGERLYAAVRQSGYAGSRATFYRWLTGVRAECAAGRPACRFETGPGDQSQFDWSPYRLNLGGIQTGVTVYSQVLGFSRRPHWYPSLSERQDSVQEAIEEGWRHFGGCCRHLLIDNAKSMVLRHRGGEIRWNHSFLALCGHYRVQPIAATPAHPQTKGKVENSFRTLEGRLIAGGSWRDFSHFQEELATFENEWVQRVHQTTRVAPIVRFEEERPELLALPPNIFLGAARMLRKVNNDGLFSFDNVRYSVPLAHADGQVRVRTRQGRHLRVFDLRGNEIIEHEIAPPGSAPQLLGECYEAHKGRRRANLARLTTEFRDRYGAHETLVKYLDMLLSHHPNRPEDALARTLALTAHVPSDVAVGALTDAVEYNLPATKTLEEFLTRRLRRTPATSGPVPIHSSGRQLPELDVERPLSSYARFLPREQQR